MMKDGVVVVNTARGKIIDEEALVEALDSGKVWACGLDVFEKVSGKGVSIERGKDLGVKCIFSNSATAQVTVRDQSKLEMPYLR